MKAASIIVGILFILFGAIIVLGSIFTIIDGDSGYTLVIDVVGMLFLGIVPLVGGVFVFRLRNANRNGTVPVRTGLFFTGVFTAFFGCALTLGAAILVSEAPHDKPDYMSMAMMALFGFGPIIGGALMCKNALQSYLNAKSVTESGGYDV